MIMVVDGIYILEHFFTYIFSGFDALGIYKYPLFIVAIVGYVFLTTRSATLASLVIIVAFAVYGTSGIFGETFTLNSLMAILTIFGIAALFLAVILKRQISEVVSGE